MLKRIIVPLDGSEVSEQVFGHLDELASPETMIFPTMVIEPAVYVGMGGARRLERWTGAEETSGGPVLPSFRDGIQWLG